MTGPGRHVDSEPDLEALFKALGNEVRIEILRTLSRASRPLPFTTLQEEVGIEDSGNFNYHVDRLTGHFIDRTDRGYVLCYPGRAVIETVRAGKIASDPEIPPRRIDLPCPFCGERQEFHYVDETVHLRCTNCTGVVGEPHDVGTLMSYEFPAAGLRGRTATDIAAAAHRLYEAEVTAMVGGVCPRCGGIVGHELEVCDDHDTEGGTICETCHTRYLAWARYTCVNCSHARRFPPWFEAFHLPEVVAFFHEATGLPRTLPFPKFLADGGTDPRTVTEEVRAIDPLTLAITIGIEDARCTVLVDENLELTVDATRVV